MIYQEKPKEVARIEALYVTEATTVNDVAQWVIERNPMHLLRHFKTNQHNVLFLSKTNARILAGSYLIYQPSLDYQSGVYRLLDVETFEQLYELVPEVVEPEAPSEPGDVVEPEPPVEPEEPTEGETPPVEGEPEPTEPETPVVTDTEGETE